MPLLHAVLLVMHIIAGSLALLSGIVPMLTQKGGNQHRGVGVIYSYCMLVVFLTAVALSTVLPWVNNKPTNNFLLMVGVFSYYFVFSGNRALKNFRLPYKKLPGMQDKLAALLLLYVSGFLIVSEVMAHGFRGINPIIGTFAVIGGILAIADLYAFYAGFDRIKHNQEWFFKHMTRMLASYISALTAFLVVNNTFLPPMVAWLGPGIIGGIGITVWGSYYRKKFATEKL